MRHGIHNNKVHTLLLQHTVLPNRKHNQKQSAHTPGNLPNKKALCPNGQRELLGDITQPPWQAILYQL